jgi:predicted small metal-binding protein
MNSVVRALPLHLAAMHERETQSEEIKEKIKARSHRDI